MTTDDYAWLGESVLDGALDMAACISLIKGRTVGDVLAVFDADAAVETPIQDAFGDTEAGFVSVLEVETGVVAIEYNGFQGSLGEIIAELSAKSAVAASMFWNVEDLTTFSCAQDGELLVSIDMYDDVDDTPAAFPSGLRTLLESAGQDDADIHAIGVAMASRFTGVTFTRRDLDAIQMAHPCRPKR